MVLAVVVVEGAVSPGAIGGGGVAALRRLRGGIQFNSRGRFRRGRRQQWKIIAFQCFMHMSKMAVI